MIDNNLSRYHRVGNPAQAKVFKNAFQRRLLLQCVNHPQSIRDLSVQSGVALNKVHYHILRLLNVGLLKVVETKARAGRGIKLYKSTAPGYFVSSELIADFDADLRDKMFTTIDLHRILNDDGTVFTVDQNGAPIRKKVSQASSAEQSTVEIWKYLNLNAEQLAGFNREIIELLNKYKHELGQVQSRKKSQIKKSILVHFAYFPLNL